MPELKFTPQTPAELKKMASLLRLHAASLEGIAGAMEENGIESMKIANFRGAQEGTRRIGGFCNAGLKALEKFPEVDGEE